jgi:hypothetical protein
MGLMVDYVDSSNYQYANINCTGSTNATLQLIQVSGGTPSNLTVATNIPSFSWSADTRLTVCWDGEFIAATIGDVASPTLADAVVTTDGGGDFTGVRIAVVGTSARFDDLDVSSMGEDCPQCSQCNECDPHLTEIQVDLAGFLDDGCECSALNSTHFLPLSMPQFECSYELEGTFANLGACGNPDYSLSVVLLPSDEILVTLAGRTSSHIEVIWEKSGIGTCADWDGLDIPFTSGIYATPGFPGNGCGNVDGVTADPTCAITAA